MDSEIEKMFDNPNFDENKEEDNEKEKQLYTPYDDKKEEQLIFENMDISFFLKPIDFIFILFELIFLFTVFVPIYFDYEIYEFFLVFLIPIITTNAFICCTNKYFYIIDFFLLLNFIAIENYIFIPISYINELYNSNKIFKISCFIGAISGTLSYFYFRNKFYTFHKKRNPQLIIIKSLYFEFSAVLLMHSIFIYDFFFSGGNYFNEIAFTILFECLFLLYNCIYVCLVTFNYKPSINICFIFLKSCLHISTQIILVVNSEALKKIPVIFITTFCLRCLLLIACIVFMYLERNQLNLKN